MEVFVYVLGAGVIGFLIGYAWQRRQYASQSELHTLKQEQAQYKQELREKDAKYEKQRSEFTEAYQNLKIANTALEKDKEHAEKQLAEEKERAKGQLKDNKDTFKQLAEEITKTSRTELQTQNKQSLESELKPFKELLEKLENKHGEASKQHGELKGLIDTLRTQHEAQSRETQALTRALKGDQKTQGDWGEGVLTKLLESSGLQRDIHYFVQENFTDEEGHHHRPDITIKMPEGRGCVIDSKVSLTSWAAYNQEDITEEEKAIALKSHIDSIKNHIKNLSKKDYSLKLLNKNIDSIPYTFMFMPIEAAYVAAMREEREIYEQAFKQRVILVSTTTLLAVLQVIHLMWKRSDQEKNAQEIANIGGQLYDKFASFVEPMKSIGASLNKAQDAYGEAFHRLTSERKDALVPLAEKMRSLGVKSTKSIEINEQIVSQSLPHASSSASQTSIPLKGTDTDQEENHDLRDEEKNTSL